VVTFSVFPFSRTKTTTKKKKKSHSATHAVCREKPFAGKKTRGRDRKEKQSTAKREDARHGWNVL
tara:strand:- start:274 stop:468 length:195 start_codon:yes stop_codon:yes gene_type:complete